MAQQLINIGSAANDRTGDTWRDAFDKTNENFTELYDVVDAVGVVFITQESDFPTQDATTITLEANTQYSISQSFSTAKNFICQSGSSFTCGSIDGPTVSFTGTGAMFSGTDVDFYIHEARIDPGITNEAYNFTDTIGGQKKFLHFLVQVNNCARFGTFTDMLNVQIENSNSPNANDGVVFSGTSGVIFSFTKFALTSTSSSFKGVDLGTATATIIEFSNLFFVAPSGAFGVSGLANNGNVPTGRLAMVANCEFLGGMTDLENITSDDTRWLFSNNNPTKDTFPDALLSFRANVTETVISAANTPVIVNATWVENQVSQFTTTSAGRATYQGEKALPAPIDVSAGLISSGGGSIDVTLYLALNGTVISASGVQNSISGSDAQTVSIPWQTTLNEDDYIEVFVENNTNTTNIIVEYCTLRIR